jgi:hypothetical protein
MRSIFEDIKSKLVDHVHSISFKNEKLAGTICGAISPKFSAYIETIYVNKRL